MNTTPELLDVQQTAAFLQLSPRTVERLTAQNALPGFRRIGRSARWSRTVLHRWIQQGCPENAEEFERGFRQEASPAANREIAVATPVMGSTMPVTAHISTR